MYIKVAGRLDSRLRTGRNAPDRIRTCDLRFRSLTPQTRWTTWSPVSSGFRQIEPRWDRLESVGHVAPIVAPAARNHQGRFRPARTSSGVPSMSRRTSKPGSTGRSSPICSTYLSASRPSPFALCRRLVNLRTHSPRCSSLSANFSPDRRASRWLMIRFATRTIRALLGETTQRLGMFLHGSANLSPQLLWRARQPGLQLALGRVSFLLGSVGVHRHAGLAGGTA